MPLKKPEDVAEKNKDDSNDVSSDSEPMVQVGLGSQESEKMPVSDAIGLHDEMLFDPESFGIASKQSVRELRERVDRLEGIVAEMSETIEILVAAVDPDRYEMAEEAWADGKIPTEWEADGVYELQQKRSK